MYALSHARRAHAGVHAHTHTQIHTSNLKIFWLKHKTLLWTVLKACNMKNPLKINMKLLRFSLQTELYSNI